ncbi:MAG: hypothetical protein AAFU60_06380 [Bacteroidota bacterium]
MKNLFLALAAILLCCVACNKEDTPTFFSFQIDGQTYEETDIEIVADNLLSGVLSLQLRTGGDELLITINDWPDEEGTYEPSFTQWSESGQNYYGGDDGTVIITEINRGREYITGLFDVTCAALGGQDINIENGEFKLDYVSF